MVEDPDDINKPESERMRYEFEISFEGPSDKDEEAGDEDEEED